MVIRDGDIEFWLESVSQAIKNQILPETDDDYIEEQLVAAYVLTRMAHRWVVNKGSASERERDQAAELVMGAKQACGLLRDWEGSPQAASVANRIEALLLELPDGDSVVADDGCVISTQVVELLWANADALPSDAFDAARRALHESWRAVLDRDSRLYGS